LIGAADLNDSVVSDNIGGISNFNSILIGPSVRLTVINSDVSDNDQDGINNGVYEVVATATIVSTTASGNSTGGVVSLSQIGGVRVTITDGTISGTLPAVGFTLRAVRCRNWTSPIARSAAIHPRTLAVASMPGFFRTSAS